MLMNNLDPEVAERPEDLVVYGGTGKAARDWESFRPHRRRAARPRATTRPCSCSAASRWASSGRTRTRRACSSRTRTSSPRWATWENFRELERRGLMMYGQMTAGSWIYIGTQGILQGTYETFAQAGRTHFGTDDLAGRLVLSGGLGGMGGAQPLAATMLGAAFLGVEIDPARIERRARDAATSTSRRRTSTTRSRRLEAARRARRPLSVGLARQRGRRSSRSSSGAGSPPTSSPTRPPRTIRSNGYVPADVPLADAAALRRRDPEGYVRRAKESMARQVEAMLAMRRAGSHVFDYGNNLRAGASEAGLADAFDFPGFVPGVHPAHVLRGEGAVPLGGALRRSRGHRAAPTARCAELFPENAGLLPLARPRRAQGARSRGCPRASAGSATASATGPGSPSTTSSRAGEVKAPIVIGRDHLDCGSVASPNRETEAMKDGSDAVADWPILNALVNAVNGASWVSFHHGGGVGHRLLAPRRAGDRRRRHRRRPRAASSACCAATRRWACCGTRTRATRKRSASPGNAVSRGPDPRRPSLRVRPQVAPPEGHPRRPQRRARHLRSRPLATRASSRAAPSRSTSGASPGWAATATSRRAVDLEGARVLDAGGRPRHPGPRRLAHAPRLRGRARGRVRAPLLGQELPRHRPRGRRHRGHDARDPRRLRRRAPRRRRRCARGASSRRASPPSR